MKPVIDIELAALKEQVSDHNEAATMYSKLSRYHMNEANSLVIPRKMAEEAASRVQATIDAMEKTA